ncbi:MAG TPA: NAD(P)-dependent oxidoreductase [Actinomycetota bacterium]|jgi:3-hydroxyisobutyrate dehydrogenase-like beta-hydroxyacid dehydrogenase|nr:NAD(P)-dependent oxidoreductase [Actinomycetota bacterium]
MDPDANAKLRLGWLGVGRMGYPLASRLLDAGCDLGVYNRTRAKAEPLTERGAIVVDRPADLADRDIVFTMVAGSNDFTEVTIGPEGVLSQDGTVPRIVIDSSTVSIEASTKVRDQAAKVGSALLAAPVSGNPKVVKAGRLTFAVSGPKEAFDEALPYLEFLGMAVSYVGEGELSRLVKICHNLMLGVVTQSLAEITILAEKGGVPRHSFLEFLNSSVMGSTFTRYKTPAFVNLDMTPTFTPELLLKDFDLGLEAAANLNVPMPVSALVRELVMGLIGRGITEEDFAALLRVQAEASGLELEPEDVEVSDGLGGGS